MKRFGFLAMLMVLSSSAYAGDSYSFVFGGHRIHVEAPRHCRSLSCVAVDETRRSRDRYDDLDAAPDAAPAKPIAAAPAQPQASAPAQVQLARAPVQVAAPPAMPPVSKPSLQPVACASPQPVIQPSEIQAPTPPAAAPVEKPLAAAPPAAVAAPPVLKISRDSDDEPAQTPLGDWRTAGNKGSVRIEQCGRALCGYMLNSSTNAVGETVLINMKPKAASQWSGNIFSRDSGNAYYATMAMKGPNSLRVEACALGRFFCTGNVWSRVGAEPEQLMTSQRIQSAPRS